MSAHLKKRGKFWYLIDSDKRESLHTTRKALAEYRLEQYVKEQFGMGPQITIGEYFEKWIETKKPPLVRKSCRRDYEQHFKHYVLPEFGNSPMPSVTLAGLSTFQSKLLSAGLVIKTVRNVMDSSFRALWRDALNEGLVKENPFALLRWPRMAHKKPDPFTAEERDRICAWWAEHDFFYYPWVFVAFHVGMRPSEAAALRWTDVDLQQGTISITKSRNMGVEDATKTKHSERIIPVERAVVDVLKFLPSRDLALPYVFVNKFGNPLSKKWAEHNWKRAELALGIRHRKFYSTRHTFITEMVRAGQNVTAIAHYCGTSPAMIDADYCGRQELDLDRTKTAHSTDTPLINQGNLVAGPGFEPGRVSAIERFELLRAQAVEMLKSKRRA